MTDKPELELNAIYQTIEQLIAALRSMQENIAVRATTRSRPATRATLRRDLQEILHGAAFLADLLEEDS